MHPSNYQQNIQQDNILQKLAMQKSFDLPVMKYPEQKGLISIICPVYNTKEIWLRECLDSIASQTYNCWEAILVNDGSTNSIGTVLDEYTAKDPRFITIHKKNSGTLLTRKTALENSKGEFIANIDSDDTFNCQFLETMYAKITETNCDFVWCECQVTGKKSGFRVSDYTWSSDISLNISAMLTDGHGPSMVTWGKLVKRRIYEKVFFPNEHITTCEDPIQTLQIAFHAKSAFFVPENLYFYRILTGESSGLRPRPHASLDGFTNLHGIFLHLFDNNIPNVCLNRFFLKFGKNHIEDYFTLSKIERDKYKIHINTIMPKIIKAMDKLDLKACLYLAYAGFELPLKVRSFFKHRFRKLRVRYKNARLK